MRIVNCRVGHVNNPIGYLTEETHTFTWVTVDCTGKKQVAARICIALDSAMQNVIMDTGWKNLNSLGTQLDVKTKPRTRYFWTVAVKTDCGEEACSDVNFFETSKQNEPWNAKWIGCSQKTERHPVFYKKFCEEQKITAARLYICGLGLYRAYINEKTVTEELLTPYCTDYNKWVEYQTYDITQLISGNNEIRVELGCGWYLGRFGFNSNVEDKCIQPYYGDGRFKLIAEIVITYEDGSERVIGTDDSWNVTRSNITFSNIYDGERRDDTLEMEVPEKAEILGTADMLPLTARLSVPVLRHEILHPVELIKTPAGEQVFDLGQNFAGIFRLNVCEPLGTKIHVQVGEVLQNGCFYRDNLRSAKAEYWYISDGKEHVIEPKFTFYGYRYAKVEGVSNLTLDSFEGIAVYSDNTAVGSWECGDGKLNRLMKNIIWGQKSNFVDVPTDCPQRDERMGWTADTQVFVPTASYLTDSWAFYRKFLHDLALDQEEHNGLVPAVVPAFGLDQTAAVWGDAATFIPWYLYKFYGDSTILKVQYESMKAWADFLERTDGEEHLWGKHFQFGDWLALDCAKDTVDTIFAGTEEAYIAYVYYMATLEIVQKSAELLEKKEDAAIYKRKAEKVRNYIQAEYFTANGRCAITTMTGYILALHFNLTSNRDFTEKKLVELIWDAGGKFKTGFVGTPFLAGVLSSMKDDRLAYSIIHNEEYPGWLYEINLGATTVWERWNSMEADGKVSSTGMNSFNHYAYGTIGQWMWETMAGIAPDEKCPGFRHAILRPIPDYRTGWVDARYTSAAGEYRLSWKMINKKQVTVTVSVPFDCTATLILTDKNGKESVHELDAGAYEITYEPAGEFNSCFSVDSIITDLLVDYNAKEILLKHIPALMVYPARMYNQSPKDLLLSMETVPHAFDTVLEALDEELKSYCLRGDQ